MAWVHKLWDRIVHPTLCAIQPSVLLEVGGVEGGMTGRLLGYAKDHAVTIHAVRAGPPFNLDEAELAPGASLLFHDASPLEVLGDLRDVDLALIDGDHNWYTVFNQLKLIERGAEGRGETFPVVLIHDTDWPYGRRDAYRDGADIPDDFRLPARRGGLLPGVAEPITDDGLSQHLEHAVTSGGAHNGVLTAVEEFVAEGSEMIQLELPGHYGVTLVASPDRVARTPALEKLLKEFRSTQFMRAQARWLDAQRINEQISRGRLELRLRESEQQGHALRSQVDDLEARFDEYVKREAELSLALHDAVEDAARATNAIAAERREFEERQQEWNELAGRHERERERAKAELDRLTAASTAQLAEAETERADLERNLSAAKVRLRAAAREQRRLRETIRLREQEHTRSSRALVELQEQVDITTEELRATAHRLEVREEEIIERREDLREAVLKQRETDQVLERIASDVVRVRRYLDAAERSRAWRIGHRISAVFWLLTFRRAQGSGALDAALKRLDRIDRLLDSAEVVVSPPLLLPTSTQSLTSTATTLQPASQVSTPDLEPAPVSKDGADHDRPGRNRWWRRSSANGSASPPEGQESPTAEASRSEHR